LKGKTHYKSRTITFSPIAAQVGLHAGMAEAINPFAPKINC